MRIILLMAIRLYENQEHKSVGEEHDAQKDMADMLRKVCLAEIPPRHDHEEEIVSSLLVMRNLRMTRFCQ